MKNIISSTVIWKNSNPMFPRKKKRLWIIHPDNRFKIYWNIVVIISMSISITLSPYQMAFEDKTTGAFLVLEILFDTVFFIDILLTCVTGYYNKDLNLITSHSKIFKKYLKSWLFVDILACFPIHLIIDIGIQYNSLMKMTRFKLVWRLIRLFKLFRLVKIIKTKEDSSNFYLALKFSIQLERLISFLFFIGFIIHIIACFWIFLAKVIDEDETWMRSGGFDEISDGELYSIGLYWSVTTLTTVGYGDIYPKNQAERVFAFIIMIVGIISYSYTVSSISNLFATFNTRQALLDNKLDMLSDLSRKLKLSHRFHMRLSIALQYEHRNHDKEVDMIIEDLPANLRQHLIQMIYTEKIENNSFFEGKPRGFTNWVTPFLQPAQYGKNEFVVREGDFANEMFLIYKGEVNYVFELQGSFYSYQNLAENSYFGEVDLLFSEKKTYLASVLTDSGCELFRLSREKFEEILQNFEEEAIKICIEAKKKLENFKERLEEMMNAVEKTIEFRCIDLTENKKIELLDTRFARKSIERYSLFRSNSEIIKLNELKNSDSHLPKIKARCEKLCLFSENIKGMARDLLEIMYVKGLKRD